MTMKDVIKYLQEYSINTSERIIEQQALVDTLKLILAIGAVEIVHEDGIFFLKCNSTPHGPLSIAISDTQAQLLIKLYNSEEIYETEPAPVKTKKTSKKKEG